MNEHYRRALAHTEEAEKYAHSPNPADRDRAALYAGLAQTRLGLAKLSEGLAPQDVMDNREHVLNCAAKLAADTGSVAAIFTAIWRWLGEATGSTDEALRWQILAQYVGMVRRSGEPVAGPEAAALVKDMERLRETVAAA